MPAILLLLNPHLLATMSIAAKTALIYFCCATIVGLLVVLAYLIFQLCKLS